MFLIGFGHLLALALAKLGYFVVASVLTKEGKTLQHRRYPYYSISCHYLQRYLLYLPLLSLSLPKGLESLEGNVGFVAICDVTSQSEVDKLVKSIEKIIKEKSLRFWAVVNNAGIGIGAQIDITPMSAFEKVMAVNYFGVVRTTKAVLPFLKLTKHSRVINLSSIAGFIFAGEATADSNYILFQHTDVYTIVYTVRIISFRILTR